MRGKRTVKARPKSQVWLTVYSDIVTNLMMFFLVLYASTRFSADVQQKVTANVMQTFESAEKRQEQAQVQESALASLQALQELGAELRVAGISMKKEHDGVTLQLPEADSFDFGRAELKPEMRKILDVIGPPLRKYPHVIILEGHTDDRPMHAKSPYRTNWELSFARVQSVLGYLVTEKHLPPERLVAIGRGEHRPVVPNDTPENRARNRRTEIKLRAAEIDP
ncbi:MAG: flagellar motor protein MotB [Elusimicrobiota bacterium]